MPPLLKSGILRRTTSKLIQSFVSWLNFVRINLCSTWFLFEEILVWLYLCSKQYGRIDMVIGKLFNWIDFWSNIIETFVICLAFFHTDKVKNSLEKLLQFFSLQWNGFYIHLIFVDWVTEKNYYMKRFCFLFFFSFDNLFMLFWIDLQTQAATQSWL